jgi:hypothetical protein
LIREVNKLRTKLEDLGEGEKIPFLDYTTEERQLTEVIVQT